MYRIAWRDGRQEGHGDYMLSYETATEWVKYMERVYPDTKHWVEGPEPVPAPAAAPPGGE